MSRTQVFDRFGRFKRGEMSVEDQPRSGCPRDTSNIHIHPRHVAAEITVYATTWSVAEEEEKEESVVLGLFCFRFSLRMCEHLFRSCTNLLYNKFHATF